MISSKLKIQTLTLKVIGILVFLTFITSTVNAQFRNTKWGMTKQQVINAEKLKCPSVYDDLICGNETIGEGLYKINYFFANNKLYKAEYSSHGITHIAITRTMFYERFENVRKLLEEKYGKTIDTDFKKNGDNVDVTFEFEVGNTKIEGSCSLHTNRSPDNINEFTYTDKNFNPKTYEKSKL